MTVIFINEDVADLQVEIRWGGESKTEPLTIEPGAFGGFDIDAYGLIPDGVKCHIYAYKKGTNLVFHPERTFFYHKGRGAVGSYTFINELFTKTDQQAA